MKRVRAAKLIIRVGDEFLLLRNSPTHPRWPGYDDLPGGTQEPEELIEETVARETFEESSVQIDPRSVKLIHASAFRKPDTYIVYLLYIVSLDEKPPIVLSHEHDQFNWVALSQINNLEPHYQESVKYLRDNNLF